MEWMETAYFFMILGLVCFPIVFCAICEGVSNAREKHQNKS